MVNEDFGLSVLCVLEYETTLRPYHMVPLLFLAFLKYLKMHRNSTKLIVP